MCSVWVILLLLIIELGVSNSKGYSCSVELVVVGLVVERALAGQLVPMELEQAEFELLVVVGELVDVAVVVGS